MPTVLHITTSGPAWWKKTATSWVATQEPTGGYVGVVTDLAEETFVEISVPRVYGVDRKNFVQRQLATRFPESVFRTALAPRAEGGFMARLAPPLQTLAAVDPGERIENALQGMQASVAGVWSTSLLLAQMGKKPCMPANLFIVLCQPTGMRILFLKQRVPVLTRLITATHTAAEQASELIRTVRHLENTRVIEREGQRFGVLLLGAAPGLAAALAADKLDAVEPPAPWNKGVVTDWNHILFDLASKGPSGQLAPMAYRATYLARKLVQASRVAVVAVLALTVWAVSDSVTKAVRAQHSRAEVQASTDGAVAQVAGADAAIGAFGVSPELVRKAIAVDAEEIASAPDMEADLVRLSQVIGHIPGVRLKTLQWQVLQASEPACAGIGPAAVAPDPAQEPPPEPSRKVELLFSVLLADGAGPRQTSMQAAEISRQLSQLKGAQLIVDPARRLREGDIRTSTIAAQPMASADLEWCATLPGVVPKASAALAPAKGSAP